MSTPEERKILLIGAGMLAAFTAVLVLIFLPLFAQGNALNLMDSLYNSVSKASAYYIEDVRKENEVFLDKAVELNLELPDADFAAVALPVLERAVGTATGEGTRVRVSGQLGKILAAALADADDMFHNRGEAVSGRYGGTDARVVTYTWWQICAAMERDLNRQKLFAEATFVSRVQKKAIECAYNYFGIEPEAIGERWGTVLLSLVFYVVYTMWYGFAVMYLFAGAGFRFGH